MPLVIGSKSFSPEQHHQKYLEDSDNTEYEILYLLMSNATYLILTPMSKGLQTPGKETETVVRQ